MRAAALQTPYTFAGAVEDWVTGSIKTASLFNIDPHTDWTVTLPQRDTRTHPSGNCKIKSRSLETCAYCTPETHGQPARLWASLVDGNGGKDRLKTFLEPRLVRSAPLAASFVGVTSHESLIDGLTFPDPAIGHVLAPEVWCQRGRHATYNPRHTFLKRLSSRTESRSSIQTSSSVTLFDLDPGAVCSALCDRRGSLPR